MYHCCTKNKNKNPLIHASVLTLSHTHTHTHLVQRGVQPRLVILERPPGGATMRWPDRRGTLSSTCAPENEDKINIIFIYEM